MKPTFVKHLYSYLYSKKQNRATLQQDMGPGSCPEQTATAPNKQTTTMLTYSLFRSKACYNDLSKLLIPFKLICIGWLMQTRSGSEWLPALLANLFNARELFHIVL